MYLARRYANLVDWFNVSPLEDGNAVSYWWSEPREGLDIWRANGDNFISQLLKTLNGELGPVI